MNKSLALTLAAAVLVSACASSPKPGTVATVPGIVPAIEVTPPECGLAPPLPKRLASTPGFQASLVVGFLLSPMGDVSEVKILRTSGHPDLDNATLAQVRQWHCPRTPSRAGLQQAQVSLAFRQDAPQDKNFQAGD